MANYEHKSFYRKFEPGENNYIPLENDSVLQALQADGWAVVGVVINAGFFTSHLYEFIYLRKGPPAYEEAQPKEGKT